jgi:hypothetical protein
MVLTDGARQKKKHLKFSYLDLGARVACRASSRRLRVEKGLKEVGMHSKWFGRIGLTALVVGCLGSSTGAVGCAAERDPINRVQANAIPKSFFIGNKLNDTSDDPEFYSRSMLIDVPYGNSGGDALLFTNTINSVAKIKWAVEETRLVGRVSFERIVGTDGKGLPPKKNP